MLDSTVRIAAFGFGIMMFAGGLALVASGTPAAVSGIWAIAIGTATMIVTLIQRNRYRSESAERSHDDPGPGGGDTGHPDSRFVPTGEVFLDPTTRHLMRVYVDSRTGERRYRAER
jgi:hypothetical protein